MSWIRFFRRRRWDEERARELEAYLEIETDENIARGMSAEDARYAAHRKLGNTTRIREEIYRMNSFNRLETLWQDLRYAIRMLARNRGFTAIAVVTLALGIGATTAIFTVVNAVLLRPLPYPHPEELVYVQEILGEYGLNPFVWNNEFAAWRNQSRTLSPMAAYMYCSFNLTGGGEPEHVISGMATASFFSILGVHPLVGRVFLPEEDRPGGPPVAILSESLWKRRYRGDPSIVGKGITLDDKVYTVVGVLPANLGIPESAYALWVPVAESETGTGPFRIFQVIGRLRPGVNLPKARTELDTILQPTLRKGLKKSVVLSPWQEQITEHSRLSLLLFLGAVGFLLVIACVNVANLLLSRAATRQKEIAVRLTVGAGRTRIIRQLLTESVLLALLGGLVGLGLARGAKDLLVKFISLPALGPITLDYRVLGFSLALAVVTGLAFGLAPALQAIRISLSETLKEAGRTGTEFRSGMLFRNLLLISETALAMVLLVGAGLLFRSFMRVLGIDLGFKPERTLSLTVDLTLSKYPTPNQQARFFEQVIDGIRSLEGVRSVAGSGMPPLGGRSGTVTGLVVEGRSEEIRTASFAIISPDYFRTMGIPLRQGRDFGDRDRDGMPSVAIVNESFARRYFPNEVCLGRRVGSWVHKKDWLTIVGIVGDTRHWAEKEPDPQIYVPYLQDGQPYMTLLVHTAGNPRLWEGAVRRQVASVDKDQPVHDLAALKELQAGTLTPRRVNLLLLSAFAGLGLILASVGIYGVVSYSVSQRRHEIGVRTALGASRGQVLKLVVGQGLRSALIGTGVGLAASFGVTRFLQAMLFGVKPADPATFLVAALLWIAIALLACYIPARRATKVDPMVALRYE
ncbi:MAG TPA: ABC transporter permease [Terriglobia bacterium]|nr:ABC transporter permease [Terriglobia bacterium]